MVTCASLLVNVGLKRVEVGRHAGLKVEKTVVDAEGRSLAALLRQNFAPKEAFRTGNARFCAVSRQMGNAGYSTLLPLNRPNGRIEDDWAV